MNMKTIFLSAFHPYTSRNILSTDALAELAKQRDLWIVVFVHANKKEYITKLFGAPHVIIEGIDLSAPSRRFPTLIMKRLARYCLNSNSVRIQRYMKWKLERKYGYLLLSPLAAIISSSRFLRRAMRAIDYYVAEKDRYASFFHTYHPDTVVITDMLNERDIELAQNAYHFGVPIMGLIRSWDNLTLHGFMRILPDTLLVASEETKRQAEVLDDCPPESVKIVGIAHYDKYVRGASVSRHDFLEKMKLRGQGSIVLYAPIGDFYIENNTTDSHVVSLLGSLHAEVIVRFSPTIPVKDMEHAAAYPNMVFDKPGVNFRGKDIGDQELSNEDDSRLLNEIIYSDVIICGPSTVALDAVFLDKPVIIIGFHPDERTYYTGLARRYDFDHFKLAIECGAFRVAHSKEELFSLIDAYEKNPRLDSENRERLRKLYCGPGDGKSGMRIAHAILDSIS